MPPLEPQPSEVQDDARRAAMLEKVTLGADAGALGADDLEAPTLSGTSGATRVLTPRSATKLRYQRNE